MYLLIRKLLSFFKNYSESDRRLTAAIQKIVGSKPLNLYLYKLATQHSSVAKKNSGYKESNDRLEYLGDAILGSVVADYLFKKFPYKDEGFLTEIRSRIVNRDSLNSLAKKIGISDIVEYNENRKHSHSYKSVFGDTLEALVGAVYLDKGYYSANKFILNKLLLPHIDLAEIVKNNPNYKSKIIEWAHKENKEVRFEILEVKGKNHNKEFVAQVYVNDSALGKGKGFSKKKAEQDAAQKSCLQLNIE
ncbi:MAG: ribonuclease III [Candidatus Cyclobacteriaceae bacterium M3_2C_046]